MKDLAEFKENDSPENKKLMQAYLEGHKTNNALLLYLILLLQ